MAGKGAAAHTSKRGEATPYFEHNIPKIPGFSYMGSTRQLLTKEDLKNEPMFEMSSHFPYYPPSAKHGSSQDTSAQAKPGGGKGQPAKSKKKKAKASPSSSENAAAEPPPKSSASVVLPPNNPAPSAPDKSATPVKTALANPAPAKPVGLGTSKPATLTPASIAVPSGKKLTESEAREVEKRAAARGIDYSKWEGLDVSDDEQSSRGGRSDSEVEADEEVEEYDWVYDSAEGEEVYKKTGRTVKKSVVNGREQGLDDYFEKVYGAMGVAANKSEAQKRKEMKGKGEGPALDAHGRPLTSSNFFRGMREWMNTPAGQAMMTSATGPPDFPPSAAESSKASAPQGGGTAAGTTSKKGESKRLRSKSKTTLPEQHPSQFAAAPQEVTRKVGASSIDYSKWDHIVDSDEEREKEAARQAAPSGGGECCIHCTACYPDGPEGGHADVGGCDEECEVHGYRGRPVHTVPGKAPDEEPEGRATGRGPPIYSDGQAQKKGVEKVKESKEGAGGEKKTGLKSGFFGAPKPAGDAKSGGGPPPEIEVVDLQINHRLGGTAKPLTAYPMKDPEAQERWRTYIGTDGRLYFVEAGSAGEGTWWKPEELLDITESLAGWQELYDKTGRVYYYCPHSGVSLRTPPENLQASRDLWRQIENGKYELDAMAESVWHNIVAQTGGAKNAMEAARIATAYMMGSSAAPHSDPPAIARMQSAVQERMTDEWGEKEAKSAAAQPKRELQPVGKLTESAPKYPEKQHHWRTYQHEDGRLYFVRAGDAGPGSWTKPVDLLDIPEYLSGWQQLISISGKTYYYHVAERKATPSLPRVLSMAQELQAQCPFLTPTLTAEAFPAFLERFGQAKSVEHAGQLALEVLQSTFGLGGKASEPGHAPQPQQQSTASKPTANGQGSSAKGKAAAAVKESGDRFSVEQMPLTKYKRAQPQKYHDWQAYRHEDGRLYFVRESDPGPGTWSKPSDLQDVTEALSGWQELVGGDGRTYFWNEGQKQRQEALPEPLRKARALYDKDSGRDVTLEKVDSVISSLAAAKTPQEYAAALMQREETAHMSPKERSVLQKLVATRARMDWAAIRLDMEETARSTAAGSCGKAADVSKKAGDVSKTKARKEEGAGKAAIGGHPSTSGGAESGTAAGGAGAHVSASGAGASGQGAAGESGYRVLASGERVKVCWSCGKDETAAGKFKKCDACARARYCSRECQRTHWKSHKEPCREWAAERLKKKLAAKS